MIGSGSCAPGRRCKRWRARTCTRSTPSRRRARRPAASCLLPASRWSAGSTSGCGSSSRTLQARAVADNALSSFGGLHISMQGMGVAQQPLKFQVQTPRRRIPCHSPASFSRVPCGAASCATARFSMQGRGSTRTAPACSCSGWTSRPACSCCPTWCRTPWRAAAARRAPRAPAARQRSCLLGSPFSTAWLGRLTGNPAEGAQRMPACWHHVRMLGSPRST